MVEDYFHAEISQQNNRNRVILNLIDNQIANVLNVAAKKVEGIRRNMPYSQEKEKR